MIRQTLFTTPIAVAILLAGTVETALSQGLVWNLPPDGSWIRYEGTYEHKDLREESPLASIEPWTRHLWIKSVGTETAEFRGETVPCRWIEFKVVTGRVTEDGLDPGPLGARLYKVLIPEPAVVGKLDDDGIPVSALPVVKGYRKFGDGPIRPVTSNVLQVYPVISLIGHYREWNRQAEGPKTIDLIGGGIRATRHQAAKTMESRVHRSRATAQLWRTVNNVNFGLAKWRVTVVREKKDAIKPRSAFTPVAEITEAMEARETGTGAQSELQVPAGG